jgi:hypothetical protein
LSRAIVGRTDEIHIVERMLDDETEQPRALLIEGEAGIGKTTLFDGVLETAGERGFRSLSCRPTRSEMDLSYVGLLALLDGIGGDVVASLPPPQARVLNLILRREEPEGSFDRLSLAVAVHAGGTSRHLRPRLAAVRVEPQRHDQAVLRVRDG